MSAIDDFKECVLNNTQININDWEDDWFPLLARFADKWDSWSTGTKWAVSLLSGSGTAVFTYFLTVLFEASAAAVTAAFGGAVLTVVASASLGAFIAAVQQCNVGQFLD